MRGTDGKDHALEEFRGRWVVLFFFPKAFTTVCQSEVMEFSRRAGDFAQADAVVLGCSIDSDASQRAWAKHLGGLNIALLSDIKRDAGRRYQVLNENDGYHLRGTFFIDPQGQVRGAAVQEIRVGRSVEETLRTLKAMQTGASCPAEWKPGQPTL